MLKRNLCTKVIIKSIPTKTIDNVGYLITKNMSLVPKINNNMSASAVADVRH